MKLTQLFIMHQILFLKKTFKTLKDIENDGVKDVKSFDRLTVELVNSNREILTTIDIDVDILEPKFGYSLKKINTYDFTMDAYVSGIIDLEATTYIDGQVKEVLSKRLASGKVGVSANYTLHDKSVDVDAYANLDAVEYSVVAYEMEDWQNIYDHNYSFPARDIHNRRKYRRTQYEK